MCEQTKNEHTRLQRGSAADAALRCAQNNEKQTDAADKRMNRRAVAVALERMKKTNRRSRQTNKQTRCRRHGL